MGKRIVGVALALVLVFPSAALAAPLEAPSETSETSAGQAPRADSNGDNISDGLEALIETAHPSYLFDVIVTFADDASAGASEQTLPPEAIAHRFGLISGYSASLNAGQISALAKRPGIVRVEEVFAVTSLNDSANADFGTARAPADFPDVDGSGVGICIADTGLDPNHEQFDDAGKIGGWADFIGTATTPYDDHGHGTHVAGTAAGSGTEDPASPSPDAAQLKGRSGGDLIYRQGFERCGK